MNSIGSYNLYSRTKEELENLREEVIAKLPSRAFIYLLTDNVYLTDQITGLQHVNKIYNEDLNLVYHPNLQALQK